MSLFVLLALLAPTQLPAGAQQAWAGDLLLRVNPLTAGTILHTSWGYDQTTVELYVVTRVSGRRVWIREIAQDSETIGFMQCRCWPAMPIRMVGEETMHTAQPSGPKGASVKIQHHYAYVEDGRAHYSSSYA